MAFWAERFLPSGVFGPRDLAPLRRAASARALDVGMVSPLGRLAPGRRVHLGVAGFRLGFGEVIENGGDLGGGLANYHLGRWPARTSADEKEAGYEPTIVELQAAEQGWVPVTERGRANYSRVTISESGTVVSVMITDEHV